MLKKNIYSKSYKVLVAIFFQTLHFKIYEQHRSYNS